MVAVCINILVAEYIAILLHKTLIPNLSQDFGHITAAQRLEPVTHGFCAGDPLERLKLCQVYTHHLPEKACQM